MHDTMYTATSILLFDCHKLLILTLCACYLPIVPTNHLRIFILPLHLSPSLFLPSFSCVLLLFVCSLSVPPFLSFFLPICLSLYFLSFFPSSSLLMCPLFFLWRGWAGLLKIAVSVEESDIVLEDVMGKTTKYTYDKVYGSESTQEELYEDAVAPIVEQVARGMSCCIFAYGQTGTGKTYTMRGELGDDVTQHGVIQRSVDNLFRRLQEHEYSDIKVAVSFLEIYNEELEDLFVDRPKDDPLKKASKKQLASQSKMVLTDDSHRGTVCQGLSELAVLSADEVMALLRAADKRCRVSETKMNKMSNRAHRIFTIIAKFKRYDTDVISTLTFVDLAGSEDILKSGATGLTAREASHINKSLLTLGRVINALACNEKHIPYRDSKLTRLLSEALGGVCKTSFIACISPCGTSGTETSSTLRYAERAMEALNISQLPRWKQDEIMIDGLTRRVQQLMDDLTSQDKMHREEMQEISNQKAALTVENNDLRVLMYHLSRKNEKLEARKLLLKHGLSLMTVQRDTLHSQKEALRTELVDTRKQRDGFLNDRGIMLTVLGTARSMRDRLLVAHGNTESALTNDAMALKRAIEGAIQDIDDLHREVARKKTLSAYNENAADDFRDTMSSKLRQIVSAVGTFKSNQGQAHDNVHELLSNMRNHRQQETSALRQDMSKLSNKATEILATINSKSAEYETQTKSRIAKDRDESENHRDEVNVAVNKLRTSVLTRIDELRQHAKGLEESMTVWTDKVKAKIDENTYAANQFAKHVTNQATSMQAQLESASNAQLQHLKQHHANLQRHLDSERTTMNTETERLIDNVNSYVNRMLNDFKTLAVRRTELAVGNFQTEVDAVCGETRDLVNHQVNEFGTLEANTSSWDASITKSFAESQTNNGTSHKLCYGLLNNVRNSAVEAETEMAVGADAVETLTKQYYDLSMTASREATVAADQTRVAYEKLTAAGTRDLQGDNEAVRVRIQQYGATFAAAGDTMKADLEKTMNKVRDHSDSTTDDLFDTEADTVAFVMQTIRRDTQAPPPQKEYRYPTDYKATDDYAAILRDLPEDWGREASIRQGMLMPGKGPDYPGELGQPDETGIVSSTKSKALAAEDTATLTEAAHQSEPEDYETDKDGPASDSEEEEDELQQEN